MINVNQLSDLVIKPALMDLVLYSEAALELLLFTCAVESNGGSYIQQESGPAVGIFQMEPNTYNDIWVNYINLHDPIKNRLIYGFGITSMPSEDRMIYDLRFASAMARIHYDRVEEPLPEATDVNGLWKYYKTYYNTDKGKANASQAILAYHSFKSYNYT